MKRKVALNRSLRVPGLVFDYVEHPPGSKYIPTGWPKTEANKFYITPGIIRRPTE